MKIKQISITIGRTINTGNYSSLKIEAGTVADLEEGDTAEAVYAEAAAEARKALAVQYEALKPKEKPAS